MGGLFKNTHMDGLSPSMWYRFWRNVHQDGLFRDVLLCNMVFSSHLSLSLVVSTVCNNTLRKNIYCVERFILSMIIDIEIELWRPLENRTTHFDSRKKVLKGSLGVTLFLVVVYPNSNRDIKKKYTTTSYLFFKVNLHTVCSSNLGAHPTEILFGSNNCLKKK